jgi:hypothetical protein
MSPASSGPRQGKRKRFFFEKKNQKTMTFGTRLFQLRSQMNKSFLLLFFKKEALAFLFVR